MARVGLALININTFSINNAVSFIAGANTLVVGSFAGSTATVDQITGICSFNSN